MTAPLQQGIARVRGTLSGPIVGYRLSCLLPTHVMTCAHVVNEALARAPDEAAWPQQAVLVEFPFASRRPGLMASVVEWRPPGERDAADIAVLELIDEVRIGPFAPW